MGEQHLLKELGLKVLISIIFRPPCGVETNGGKRERFAASGGTRKRQFIKLLMKEIFRNSIKSTGEETNERPTLWTAQTDANRRSPGSNHLGKITQNTEGGGKGKEGDTGIHSVHSGDRVLISRSKEGREEGREEKKGGGLWTYFVEGPGKKALINWEVRNPRGRVEGNGRKLGWAGQRGGVPIRKCRRFPSRERKRAGEGGGVEPGVTPRATEKLRQARRRNASPSYSSGEARRGRKVLM